MNTDHRDKPEEAPEADTSRRETLQRLHELVEQVRLADFDKALQYAKEELKIAEEMADRRGIAVALYDCAFVYSTWEEFTVAIEYARRAREEFREAGDVAMAYKSQSVMASASTRIGELPAAISLLEECLQYWTSVDNHSERALTLSSLGQALYNLGDYPAAMAKLLDALVMLEESGDWKRMCVCCNTLGFIYAAMGEVAMIRYYFEKHLAAAQKWGDLREQIGALQNLVVWCSNENRPDEALAFYQQAEALDPRHKFLYVPLVLTAIYRQQGEYGKALKVCRQELAALKKSDRKREMISTLFVIGNLYEASGQVSRALQAYAQVAEIGQEIGNNERLLESYLRRARLCEKTKRYRLATQYFSQYTDLRRDVEEQQKQKAIAEMQMKFDVRSVEREKELLRTKNAELSAVLAEVRHLNDDLTKLNSEKSEVLSIVAHDLKSPLAGVRMVASLLKAHYRQMPQDELEQQLDTIIDSTDRMLSISSSLLKAQQVETEEVFGAPEQIDVCWFVRRIAESYVSAAEEKQISIGIAGEACTVLCSREALRQAVENLISNAVKFTRRGGCVQVRVQQHGTRVRVEVEDEGPGIEKSERRKLYRKYSRLSARPTGGESTTGLGLWITKKAVEAMHGRLLCRSEVGKGSVFRMELPREVV